MDIEQENDRLRLEIAELENKTKYDDMVKNYNLTSKMSTKRSVGIKGTGGKDISSSTANKNNENNIFNWDKSVNFEDIQLSLLVIWSLKNEGFLKNY